MTLIIASLLALATTTHSQACGDGIANCARYKDDCSCIYCENGWALNTVNGLCGDPEVCCTDSLDLKPAACLLFSCPMS